MANSIITPSKIANEALYQFENNLVMGNLVNRQYKNEFVKAGTSVALRMPVKFQTTKSATRTNSDVTEKSNLFTVATQAHVSWKFSTADLTMSIEEYSKRYITPAMISLANTVDSDLCALYKDVNNATGTAGTTPSTFAALGAAAQRLDENAAPVSGRKLVLNPAAHWAMADALKGLNIPQRAEGFITKGALGMLAGFDINMDQNIYAHTKGTATGTPLVNGASQNVTYASLTNGSSVWSQSLITDGWTNSVTGILKQGDVFTIAGVYAVNPVSGLSTGALRQFTVLADANSGASTGPATLSIAPPIITSGAYATCDSAPADNAAITVVASHAANLAFQEDAFGLVMMPMELPTGAAFKARKTYNNLSIRVVNDFDIDADEDIIRLDIMYGTKTLNPALAVRLMG